MSARSRRPDLNAFMDAYAILGVEYGASPLYIRKAFKQKARQQHPDRYPAGSPEQQQATERMTALNGAYRLIRDAPLRHHRVSTGARADEPWTDDELDAAVRRSRNDIAVSKGISVVVSVLGVWLCLAGVPFSPLAGWPFAVTFPLGVLLAWLAYVMAAQTGAGLYAFTLISYFRMVFTYGRMLR